MRGTRVVLVGGRASVELTNSLVRAGLAVTAIANTGQDREGSRPDVEALEGAAHGTTVIPVTDDPNPTTVIVSGTGELPAADWVELGRPGKLLAVRMAGTPSLHPMLAASIEGAAGTFLGPDDPDLVIDPVLKVLAQSGQRLPAPVVSVGHDHHRFEGFATLHIDGHFQRERIEALLAGDESHG